MLHEKHMTGSFYPTINHQLSNDMAGAEEVQYLNNPIVAPAPAQIAPPAVPNEQRDMENAQPENYV